MTIVNASTSYTQPHAASRRIMSAQKSKGIHGMYPKCERHIVNAGLTMVQASEISEISTASILRIKKQQPVLVTTIMKLINALNKYHYVGVGRPLDPDVELVRLSAL